MRRRALAWFVMRRLAALGAVLLLVSFIVFSLLYLAPGSPEQLLLGPREATPTVIAEIRHMYHLDQPFLAQYWDWLSGAVQLHFGQSIVTQEPVMSAINGRLWLSVQLAIFAFVIALLFGVALGVLAATRRRSGLDRSIVGLSVIGVSAPAFATGVLLLYLFAVKLSWFPVFGDGSGFGDRLWHLALPAFALALTAMGLIVRLTRAGTITALEQDYVAFARARGISPRRILTAYVLRNSLVPIITGAGLILAYLLAGAVLVEVTFALPGIGSLLVDSITSKDIPVVQALAMLIALCVVVINLVVDLLYLAIDPRHRHALGHER
jgi:peptide/nickel transport system permease protein